MQTDKPPADYACPSGQPEMADARVLGIVETTAEGPRVAYLNGRERVRPSALNLPPDVMAHVVRLSARCENSACAQFAKGKCGLGQRIAATLPDVVTALPSCTIRNSCRWYAEQGSAICFKCPQVVTLVPSDGSALARVARPVTEAELAGCSEEL